MSDVEPTSIISILVAAADALSAARPVHVKRHLKIILEDLRDSETLSKVMMG